jgi:rSAM/selenodomain-associated transferase 2
MRLSVIVPMLNEQGEIGATLDRLMRAAPAAEIIVVNGGSNDGSVDIVRDRFRDRAALFKALAHCVAGDVESERAGATDDASFRRDLEDSEGQSNLAGLSRMLDAPRGRARQMNAGARAAHGEVLVFVHADTLVPPTFVSDIKTALTDTDVVGGRFDVELDEVSLIARLLGRLISLRSRIMHSATGDQAIFVRRETFLCLAGFAEIDLCEDVDFARRLKRTGQVACLRSRVVTSARRWRRNGVFRTVLRMWLIKSLFLAGVSPAWLRRHYADTR